MAEHTPTLGKNLTLHLPVPWELVEATEHHGPYIVNQWGGTVADLYAMSNPTFPSTRNGGISRPVPFDSADANAAFIVKAVNNHEVLMKALEPFARIDLAFTDDIDDSALVKEYEGGCITLGDCRAARAALALCDNHEKMGEV